MTDQYNFITVRSMEIFDADDRTLAYRYKGIVNEADPAQLFCIVGKDYKIVQHQEVLDIVKTAIENAGLEYTDSVGIYNEGGRINIRIKFPTIKYAIGGEGDFVKMMVTFDNSFDGTSALKLDVAATVVDKQEVDYNFPLYSTVKMSKFTRKHTKGIDPRDIGKILDKAIKLFHEKVLQQFETLVHTTITHDQAKNLLKEIAPTNEEKGDREDVYRKIPNKYLSLVRDAVERETNINSLWKLYNIASKIFSTEVKNIDSAKKFAIEFNTLIRSRFVTA